MTPFTRNLRNRLSKFLRAKFFRAKLLRAKLLRAFIFFSLLAPLGCSTLPHNPWAEVLSPVEAPDQIAQSIGSYSAGCLVGAKPLPFEGRGFQLMRPSRRRIFGHPSLIRVIERLASQVAAKNLGTLLVGDLAQPRGGPTNSSHRSHQTGLDVDIWFLQPTPVPRNGLTLKDREEVPAVSVLTTQEGILDPQTWSPKQVDLLKLAAEEDEVERIFVHPSIKLHLCHSIQNRHSRWMGKLRPWWSHHDHFHLRLRCPPNQPQCVKQADAPAGDGCDATLQWWFTDEAKAKPSPEEGGGLPPLPKLPEECAKVLKMGPPR